MRPVEASGQSSIKVIPVIPATAAAAAVSPPASPPVPEITQQAIQNATFAYHNENLDRGSEK